MKILYVLYSFNRPQILKACLETLFNNNNLRPTEMIVLDDGSNAEQQANLFNFTQQKAFPIHFFCFGQNQGLGYQWQLAWEFIRSRDYDYIVQIEQDYIFRKNGLDEAIQIMQEKPLAALMSIYNNPDFSNGKQNSLFPEVMVELFGEDPAKREYLHKPFNHNGIEIQLTTNSCGSFIMNWNRVKQLLDKYPEMWDLAFNRAFNKYKPDQRKYAGDGPLTCGISYYWYADIEDRIKKGETINYDTEGSLIDLCDFSISEHLNGGESLNGYIVPEFHTFVGSPKWKNEYLDKNPRLQIQINMSKIFSDERGQITPLYSTKDGDVLRITSKQGSKRAGHYHLNSGHHCIVTAGTITYYERPMGSNTKPKRRVYFVGEVFFTDKMVEHLMVFDKCPFNEFICIATGNRNQENYEKDLVRLEGIDLEEIYNNFERKDYKENDY